MGVPHTVTTLLLVLVLVCWRAVFGAEDSPLRYELLEEEPPNTFIANIITDRQLDRLYLPSVLDTFRFDILPGKYTYYFSVHETLGLFRVNTTFDRESECLKRRECMLDLDVAIVHPVEHFQVIKVQVTILDKNDNSPKFPDDHVTLRIPESAPLGRPGYSLQGARDRDTGVLAVQSYQLISNTPKLGLSALKNLDGSFDLHIIVNRSLDHEAERSYSLQLIAYDGGSPPNRGTLFIDVQVTDTNDNSPQFEQAMYNVSILEDVQPYTPLVQVRATDQDQGANGLILYTLTTQTSELHGHLFHINNVSGEIFMSHRGELEESYELVIQAQDQGEDALRAFTKVYIQVQDVNNHSPVIKVNTLTSSGHAEVKENTPSNAFVSHLTVEDMDRGHNGLVTCSIQDPNFQLVQLYTTQYKVVSSVSFDREMVATYNVMIYCEDNGVPPLQSARQLTVDILDENDHSPVFTRESYTESLAENNNPNTPVFALTASDRDLGNNAKVSYSLADPTGGHGGPALVTINPNTGIVSTLASFDREEQEQYVFEVVAVDMGEPQQSSTATLTLNIHDVNDEPPVFKQSAYSFGTYENQSPGTEIGTLAAGDPDLPPYNSYEFSLKPVDTMDYGTFEIEAESGKITALKRLDRETVPAYYMVATVRDKLEPSLSSTASVTVYVADINDNAPTITYPTHDNNTVHVSYYAPIGYIFAKASAEDADLGNNAKLHYELAGGNEDGYFDIDPAVGAVFINTPMHLHETNTNSFSKAKDVYMLTILVTDYGSTPKSASAILRVLINRSEEFAHDGALMGTSTTFELGYHQKIIIILGSVTGVLVVILVAAILLVKRRQMQHNKETYRHMCAVEVAPHVGYEDAGAMGRLGDHEGSSTLPAFQADNTAEKHNQFAAIPAQVAPSCTPCPGLSCYPTLPCSRGLPPPLPSDDASQSMQGLPLFTQDHDAESTSGCSGDSGHGPSEEGDPHNTSLCNINPSLGTAGYTGSATKTRKAPLPPPRTHQHRTLLTGSDVSITRSQPSIGQVPYYKQPLGTFQPQGHSMSKDSLPVVAQDIKQQQKVETSIPGDPPERANRKPAAPPIPKRQPITKLSSSRQPALLPQRAAVGHDVTEEDDGSDCDGGSSTSGSFTVQLEEEAVRSVDV